MFWVGNTKIIPFRQCHSTILVRAKAAKSRNRNRIFFNQEITMSNPTLDDTLQEFDAGVFVEKVTQALKKVALGVVNNHKKGQLNITLDLEQIGETDYVKIKHTLKYNQPTIRGKLVEDNASETPMHVSREGFLSISPLNQDDLFNPLLTNVSKINQGQN
jgi:hypothetical protein